MRQIALKEVEKIKKYRGLFPEAVKVLVKKNNQGYIGEVLNWPGAYTQADTFAELIFMVNDCVRTILEVPQKYATEMPNYLPPLDLAQKFNEFPSSIKEEPIQFLLNFNSKKSVCR